jgi:hypothetical protein
MNLHKDTELFKNAVTAAAQQLNMQSIYIEKDYWVTFVLHTIFQSPIGPDVVFKGGTALSKCFNLIDRFSEDIDLVVLRREGETNNQLTNKIRNISDIVSAVLPEVELKNVTQKRGMNRKTAHNYNKLFTGNFGQVRDVLIVEASWLGNSEPRSNKKISSYIYDMMLKNNQLNIAEEHGLLPFEAMVLDPKRTICEKIMSLVRFSYSEDPLGELKKKIRHTYDLYKLLNDAQLSEFFNSKSFDALFIKVANDDVVSFKNNNAWLVHHPLKSKVFSELETVWKELIDTYKGAFKDLVFKDFPAEDKILQNLLTIKKRLETIEWNIEVEARE